jgi:hypothetical protein
MNRYWLLPIGIQQKKSSTTKLHKEDKVFTKMNTFVLLCAPLRNFVEQLHSKSNS